MINNFGFLIKVQLNNIKEVQDLDKIKTHYEYLALNSTNSELFQQQHFPCLLEIT